jgi:hypothetical protein
MTTGWMIGRSGFDSRQGQRIFPVASVSRPALGPTQPPVQRVPGVLSPVVKRGRGVTLTTHLHLIPRSRMSRSYTSSPPSASMACSGTSLLLWSLSRAAWTQFVLSCLISQRSACMLPFHLPAGLLSGHVSPGFLANISQAVSPVSCALHDEG